MSKLLERDCSARENLRKINFIFAYSRVWYAQNALYAQLLSSKNNTESNNLVQQMALHNIVTAMMRNYFHKSITWLEIDAYFM